MTCLDQKVLFPEVLIVDHLRLLELEERPDVSFPILAEVVVVLDFEITHHLRLHGCKHVWVCDLGRNVILLFVELEPVRLFIWLVECREFRDRHHLLRLPIREATVNLRQVFSRLQWYLFCAISLPFLFIFDGFFNRLDGD